MAYEENLKSISYDADASIGIYTGVPGQPGSAVPNGGKQFHCVRLTGKNQVGLAITGQPIFGVLQNKPQRPGQAATVGYDGVTWVTAGAVIAVGDTLVADAQGRVIPGTLVAGSRRLVAVMPAAGAGELISAQFTA
jgi:hypothetical protein